MPKKALQPTARPARGRPRAFDVDAVAEAALRLFWERGFEATSLEDVTERTGVNASSLYAAYGSKRGLFGAALDRYRQFVGEALVVLAEGDRGLDDVIEFVSWVRRGITSSDMPSGCLMVNSMVELGATDPELAEVAAAHRDRIRSALREALRRAERSGEIERRTGAFRALVVEAALFGALVTGQASAIAEADEMLVGLIAEIKRWRVDSAR
ncbi:MAG: TetR/AcrR family transcriptional regulator [Acidimicrobiia bacterium]